MAHLERLGMAWLGVCLLIGSSQAALPWWLPQELPRPAVGQPDGDLAYRRLIEASAGHVARGQRAEAVVGLFEAHRLQPQAYIPHQRLCAILPNLGRLEEAITHCRLWRARAPTHRQLADRIIAELEAELQLPPAERRKVPPTVAPAGVSIELPAAAAPAAGEQAPRGWLSVQSRYWGSVVVNGRVVARETPLLRKDLPAGTYRLQVCYEGKRDRCTPAREVEVRAGEDVKVAL